jgi:RHS repeat-associated protein
MDAEGEAIVAHYEYDPYGMIVASFGQFLTSNAYRFSTKYYDNESEFYYFGYRCYFPGNDRWLSRDPINEAGGKNLYLYVFNNPVSRIDYLGNQALNIERYANFAPSQIADAFDEYYFETIHVLDLLIEKDPCNLWMVAATVKTAMDLGRDTVDILRFGEGFAQGQLIGITKDVLRGLGIVFSLKSLVFSGRHAIELPVSTPSTSLKKQKAVVIGEGMEDIKTVVRTLRKQGIEAKWYQAWSKNFKRENFDLEKSMKRNERWIKSKIKESYIIYDIGIDPLRTRRSLFYNLEKEIIENKNYHVIPMKRQ